jgi:hypothetical protein
VMLPPDSDTPSSARETADIHTSTEPSGSLHGTTP